MPFLKAMKVPIPVTDHLDPLSMLIDDADMAAWNNEGLPADRMSYENATILTNCERWPLMIDPQLQGKSSHHRSHFSHIDSFRCQMDSNSLRRKTGRDSFGCERLYGKNRTCYRSW